MSADSPRPAAARRLSLAPLVVLALLPAPAATQPTAYYLGERPPVSERVEKVRQALQKFNPDLDPKAAQEGLGRLLNALRGVNDLGQALALPEWGGRMPVPGGAGPAGRDKVARDFEEALGKALEKDDPTRQCAAVTLFADMTLGARQPWGPRSPDPFVTKVLSRLLDKVEPLTKSGDTGVRQAVARALGRSELDPSKTVPLLERLLGDKEVMVKRAAAAGLVRQAGGADTGSGGIVSLERPVEANLAACGAVVPAAVRGLDDKDEQVSRDCAEAVKQSARGYTASIQALRHGFGPILQVPPVPVKPLRGGEVPPDDPSARLWESYRQAAGALGKGAESLRPLLKDEKAERRVQACQALEAVATGRARLLQLVADGAALPEAIGAKEDPLLAGLKGAVPDLADCADDKNVEVRLAALYVLEDLGPAAAPAVGKVVKGLKADDPFVRWAAARVLGKMAPEEAKTAVPALAEGVGDENGDVRITALAALKRYGPAALAAIKEVGGAAIKGGDEQTRLWAVRVLAAVGAEGRKQTTAPLIEALSAKGVGVAVRRAAAAALARFGKPDEATTVALRAALADDDGEVRRTASEALLVEE